MTPLVAACLLITTCNTTSLPAIGRYTSELFADNDRAGRESPCRGLGQPDRVCQVSPSSPRSLLLDTASLDWHDNKYEMQINLWSPIHV
jgi:hypothetical protein